LHETTQHQSSIDSLSLKLPLSTQYTDRKRLSVNEHKKAIKYKGVTVRKNVKQGVTVRINVKQGFTLRKNVKQGGGGVTVRKTLKQGVTVRKNVRHGVTVR